MLTLLPMTFAKRRIRHPNAKQEVSNTNHFGSVSNSLGRFEGASEFMAMIIKLSEHVVI